MGVVDVGQLPGVRHDPGAAVDTRHRGTEAVAVRDRRDGHDRVGRVGRGQLVAHPALVVPERRDPHLVHQLTGKAAGGVRAGEELLRTQLTRAVA